MAGKSIDLNLIVKAVDQTGETFQRVQRQAENLGKGAAEGSNAVNQAFNQIKSGSEGVSQSFSQLGSAFGQMSQGIVHSTDPLNMALGSINLGVQNITQHLAGMNAGFALLASAVGITTALGAATEFLATSLSHASQETTNLIQLSAIWKSMNRGNEESMMRLVDQVKDLSREGMYSSQSVVGATKLFASFGNIASDQLVKATKVAQDFAAFTGQGMEHAAYMIRYAATGMYGMLNRVGVQISETAKKSKDFNIVLEEIAQKMKGQMAAAMETYTGQVAALEKTFDRVRKAMGHILETALVPVMKEMGASFSAVGEQIENAFKEGKFEPVIAKLTELFGKLAKGMTGALEGIVDWAQNADFDKIAERIFSVAESVQHLASYSAQLLGWLLTLPGWVLKAVEAFILFKVAIGAIHMILGSVTGIMTKMATSSGSLVVAYLKEAAGVNKLTAAYEQLAIAKTAAGAVPGGMPGAVGGAVGGGRAPSGRYAPGSVGATREIAEGPFTPWSPGMTQRPSSVTPLPGGAAVVPTSRAAGIGRMVGSTGGAVAGMAGGMYASEHLGLGMAGSTALTLGGAAIGQAAGGAIAGSGIVSGIIGSIGTALAGIGTAIATALAGAVTAILASPVVIVAGIAAVAVGLAVGLKKLAEWILKPESKEAHDAAMKAEKDKLAAKVKEREPEVKDREAEIKAGRQQGKSFGTIRSEITKRQGIWGDEGSLAVLDEAEKRVQKAEKTIKTALDNLGKETAETSAKVANLLGNMFSGLSEEEIKEKFKDVQKDLKDFYTNIEDSQKEALAAEKARINESTESKIIAEQRSAEVEAAAVGKRIQLTRDRTAAEINIINQRAQAENQIVRNQENDTAASQEEAKKKYEEIEKKRVREIKALQEEETQNVAKMLAEQTALYEQQTEKIRNLQNQLFENEKAALESATKIRSSALNETAQLAEKAAELSGKMAAAYDAVAASPERAIQLFKEARSQAEGLAQSLDSLKKSAQDALRGFAEAEESLLKARDKAFGVSPIVGWQRELQAVIELLNEAQAAYQAGDLARAKQLSEQGKSKATSLGTSAPEGMQGYAIQQAMSLLQGFKNIYTQAAAADIRARQALQAQAEKTAKEASDQIRGLIQEQIRQANDLKATYAAQINALNDNTAALRGRQASGQGAGPSNTQTREGKEVTAGAGGAGSPAANAGGAGGEVAGGAPSANRYSGAATAGGGEYAPMAQQNAATGSGAGGASTAGGGGVPATGREAGAGAVMGWAMFKATEAAKNREVASKRGPAAAYEQDRDRIERERAESERLYKQGYIQATDEQGRTYDPYKRMKAREVEQRINPTDYERELAAQGKEWNPITKKYEGGAPAPATVSSIVEGGIQGAVDTFGGHGLQDVVPDETSQEKRRRKTVEAEAAGEHRDRDYNRDYSESKAKWKFDRSGFYDTTGEMISPPSKTAAQESGGENQEYGMKFFIDPFKAAIAELGEYVKKFGNFMDTQANLTIQVNDSSGTYNYDSPFSG